MKTSENLKIIHESQTQRQHIRLPFPAQAEIDGRHYDVKELSVGGISLRDVDGNFFKGQRVRLQLRLPFSGFALDADLEAVVRHYHSQRKILGCAFAGPSPGQISLLNHVLKSFIAGDVVASNDIPKVASRNNFAKPRRNSAERAYEPALKHQLHGLLAVTVAGLLIAFFITGNLYSSLFLDARPRIAAEVGAAQGAKMTAETSAFPAVDFSGIKAKISGLIEKIEGEWHE